MRWVDTAPASAVVIELRMQRLRWAKQRGRRGGWFDVVSLDSIMRPVFQQPDTLHEEQWFFNDYQR